ncbi:MAG: PEP-CTERM sorting domain-containing protein [Desulfuromonadales bacterium]|nr:PEP-CTERM sorting domain-containing protein [Desulfuromonadales bacterium]
MKKLLRSVGLAVVCGLSVLAGSATAAPLFTAITTIDLGSMVVTTTGDLQVNWGAPQFDRWVNEGTGSGWYTGNELGASSEIWPEDLRFEGGGAYPDYYGHADSYVSLKVPFTTEGEGMLSLTVPFHAEYDTGPYPDFDAYGSGPDFCHGTLMLVNGEEADWQAQNFRIDRFQIDMPATWDYLMRAEDLAFSAGESGYYSLFAYAESSVFYWQIPELINGGGQPPVPTPEPGTLLLLGGGLLAGALACRRPRR